MVDVVGETPEEAERKLQRLCWALDRTDYDDDDEFAEAVKDVFPEQITAQAKHAAELGSAIGMHSYARLLLQQAMEKKEAGEPYEELQTQARDLTRQAAVNGCWGAMDDMGRMQVDELGVERIEMLSFMELSGGDMMDYVEHCHKLNVESYSQDEIDAALEAAKKMTEEMASRGIERQQCDCYSPF